MIGDVAQLKDCLEDLVPQHDVMIHSMAVSDYTPVYMTDFDTVKQAPQLDDFLTIKNQEKKITSQADYQVLFLRKTPKIISLIKTWHPKIQLIGFKLLVNVDKAELIRIARESLVKNKADYIVANDLSDITTHKHIAYLVGTDTLEKADSKEEIAQLILKHLRS